jgi:hypothetical protein
MEKCSIILKTGAGVEFIIDQEDYDRVKQYTWRFNGGYIRTSTAYNKKLGIKGRSIYLHRFILNITDNKIFIDHKNLDRKDNRKENLRICTTSQNQANIKPHKRNKTGLKGVRKTPSGKYEADIWKDKSIYLGVFNTKQEAAKVYNEAAIKFFGEFALLNNIEEIKNNEN